MIEGYATLIICLILFALGELAYGVYIAISRRHYQALIRKYERENHET